MAFRNFKDKFINSIKGGVSNKLNFGSSSATAPRPALVPGYSTMNPSIKPKPPVIPGAPTGMTTPGSKYYQGGRPQTGTQSSVNNAQQQYINQTAQNISSQQQVVPQPSIQQPQDFGQSQKPDTTKNAYIEYLKTQFNPEQAKLAQENLNATNQRIADEIARNRESVKAIEGNKQGQLASGQNYDASEESRKSNASLADLAIAKGYNADILKQYTDAGATLYEAEQAAAQEANAPLSLEDAQTLGLPFGTTMAEARMKGIVPTSQKEGFELSEGQARYEYNPTTGQYEKIASVGKTYKGGGGGGNGSYSGGMINSKDLPNLALGEQDNLNLATSFLNASEEMKNIINSTGKTPRQLETGTDSNSMLFRSLRSDMVDILARDRTGAVVGANEEKQFKKILGVGGLLRTAKNDTADLFSQLDRASARANQTINITDPSGLWKQYLSQQRGGGSGNSGYDAYLAAIGQ